MDNQNSVPSAKVGSGTLTAADCCLLNLKINCRNLESQPDLESLDVILLAVMKSQILEMEAERKSASAE